MMISLWLKNRNSFGEKCGVSLQVIRRIQSVYKTCEVNVKKSGEDRYYRGKLSQLSPEVLVKEF